MSIQDNNAPKKDQNKRRKKIRKQIAKILKNNILEIGSRVFPNASVPPWEEELPVILVYPRSEGVAKYAEAPRELERDLSVVIEIIAKGPETDEDGNPPVEQDAGNPVIEKKTLEDILDDIADQVEALMEEDDTLGDTADDSILQNTDFDFESAGGLPIGSARLTYGVTYYTNSPRNLEENNTLPDFATSQHDWHTGKVDDNTREAKDTVDIETT